MRLRDTLLLLVAALLVGAACDSSPAPKIASGVYYAYEPMANLGADEDPKAEWYRAHVMTIRGRMVVDRLSPVYFTGRGQLTYSASDGGFYLHAGTIEARGGRTLFRTQVMECDYCGIPTRAGGDPQEFFLEVHERVATRVGERAFELDGLRFSMDKDPRFAPPGGG